MFYKGYWLPWWLRWEDPLEKGMATHPSILAWRIPWTEEIRQVSIIRSALSFEA